jgi:hypothetical protein
MLLRLGHVFRRFAYQSIDGNLMGAPGRTVSILRVIGRYALEPSLLADESQDYAAPMLKYSFFMSNSQATGGNR